MDTIEELQALVDRACEEIGEYDQLHLYLPAVTYTGGLEIGDRLVRLYGSLTPDGQRTAFTGGYYPGFWYYPVSAGQLPCLRLGDRPSGRGQRLDRYRRHHFCRQSCGIVLRLGGHPHGV